MPRALEEGLAIPSDPKYLPLLLGGETQYLHVYQAWCFPDRPLIQNTCLLALARHNPSGPVSHLQGSETYPEQRKQGRESTASTMLGQSCSGGALPASEGPLPPGSRTLIRETATAPRRGHTVNSWTSSRAVNTSGAFSQHSQPCPPWMAPNPHLNCPCKARCHISLLPKVPETQVRPQPNSLCLNLVLVQPVPPGQPALAGHLPTTDGHFPDLAPYLSQVSWALPATRSPPPHPRSALPDAGAACCRPGPKPRAPSTAPVLGPGGSPGAGGHKGARVPAPRSTPSSPCSPSALAPGGPGRGAGTRAPREMARPQPRAPPTSGGGGRRRPQPVPSPSLLPWHRQEAEECGADEGR